MSSGGEEASIGGTIKRVIGSKTHYETLGVEKDCEEKVLKKAYRKLALRLHPDKCQLEGAEEAFKKVSNAYGCLSDPGKRSHYDRFGSDAPEGGLGGGGGGGGVDPNEFFRDFMAQNPDFAAGFRAGVPPGGAGGGGGGGINLSDFDFSAGTLATGRSWWANKAATLNPPWLRGPFRALGVLVFAFLTGFFATMPYSAMVVGVVALYVASQAVWWILQRGIWLMAFRMFPFESKPGFLSSIGILLAAEYIVGMVFDFQRGMACYMVLWAFQIIKNGRSGGGASSSQQQPRQSSSGFSFQTGPGFVHFGAMPSNINTGGGGRVGGGGGRGPQQQQQQNRRVHQ